MAQILIYGDSITEGFWDSAGGWADRVKRSFYQAYTHDGLQGEHHMVYNLGVSGDTLNDIAERFESEIHPRIHPGHKTAVIIAAGINDSRAHDTQDNVISTPEVYRADLELLAQQVIGTIGDPNIMFVGLTPVDESKTNPRETSHKTFITNDRIRMFDDVLLSFCAEFEFAYVPLFDKFMESGATGLLSEDGLHPNDKGHELIAEQVAKQLSSLMKVL